MNLASRATLAFQQLFGIEKEKRIAAAAEPPTHSEQPIDMKRHVEMMKLCILF